jgi:hypothetical protein
MQALDIQRRFAGTSLPAGIESSVGEEDDDPGSALGRMIRGGGLLSIAGWRTSSDEPALSLVRCPRLIRAHLRFRTTVPRAAEARVDSGND